MSRSIWFTLYQTMQNSQVDHVLNSAHIKHLIMCKQCEKKLEFDHSSGWNTLNDVNINISVSS